MPVIDRDLGWGQLKRIAEQLKDAPSVKVGFLADQKEERHGESATNIEVAIFNEFGTETIPERSFVRSTFDNKREQWAGLAQALTQRIMDGKLQVKAALNLLGLRAANDIKNTVTAGAEVPPPNAPSTLKRKQAKGKGDPRTLVDTGQMVNATTWALDDGGEK